MGDADDVAIFVVRISGSGPGRIRAARKAPVHAMGDIGRKLAETLEPSRFSGDE